MQRKVYVNISLAKVTGDNQCRLSCDIASALLCKTVGVKGFNSQPNLKLTVTL